MLKHKAVKEALSVGQFPLKLSPQTLELLVSHRSIAHKCKVLKETRLVNNKKKRSGGWVIYCFCFLMRSSCIGKSAAL